MNITQTFYDSLASQYEKLFFDWQAAVREQAVLLDKLFSENGLDRSRSVLDCACGIGTQAIGLSSQEEQKIAEQTKTTPRGGFLCPDGGP